jgi:hypothetical protein
VSDYYSTEKGLITIEAAPENQLVLTVDRAKVRLMEHLHRVGGRWDFAVPAGILATLIATLCATDFKNSLGVPKDTWHAVFLVASVVCVVWAVALVPKAIRRKTTIDDLIELLKQDTAQARAAASGSPSPLVGKVVVTSRRL